MTLTELQDAIAATLAARPEFAGVQIFTEKIGDIASEIEIAVGKIGICIVILTPSAGVQYPNVPGPLLDPVRIVVAIFEDVIINRSPTGTNKPAADVATDVLRTLQLTTPAGANPIVPDGADALKLIPDSGGLLVYHANFTTILPLTPLT
ncbi:MAG: hypothetical protein HY360_07675 [Verrucomicrobia bacterium]|nr:hypothetical protein [Verrucomicrobiota bacterium]